MNTSQLTPWTQTDKDNWFKEQTIKRSYLNDVVSKVLRLNSSFEVVKYGALSLNPEKYPVFLILTKNFDRSKKTILITGGVHGYETSGVHGALAFMERDAHRFSHFNVVCAPCISPWAYETINRWNPKALDPNRFFAPQSQVEECDLFLKAVAPYVDDIYAHFDLHETTDTDNTVFRPAKIARDGRDEELTEIPDGFYTVGDSENPKPEFQKAIIDSVRRVTHIAPPDEKGRIIGARLEQDGVINYPIKNLFLCAGFSKAKFTTTTEVYPDSPKVTDALCIDAQVAAITGGLNYLNTQELIETNNLLPHPEGGFYKETYRSEHSTGIFYLLRKGDFSGLHRIKSDEMWHFYSGQSLTVVEIDSKGEFKETLLNSHNVQYVVPANTWFGAYLPEGSDYAFCGCTVAPAFEFKDLELAKVNPGLPERLAFLVRISGNLD